MADQPKMACYKILAVWRTATATPATLATLAMLATHETFC
jgi:hypothetical protein